MRFQRNEFLHIQVGRVNIYIKVAIHTTHFHSENIILLRKWKLFAFPKRQAKIQLDNFIVVCSKNVHGRCIHEGKD